MSTIDTPALLPGIDPNEPWPWLPRAQAWLEANEQGEMTALYVACPFCDDLHRHGGAPLQDGQTHWGMRVAHCLWGDGGSYLLVPAPEGEPRPKGLSARERNRRLMADDRRRKVRCTGPLLRSNEASGSRTQ